MKSNLNELSKEIYSRNVDKGFWDGGIEAKNIGEVIALIHSEASEALEADRKNKHSVKSYNLLNNCSSVETQNEQAYFRQEFETSVKNTFEDELADIIIRVLDVCGAMNVDIEWQIEQKMKYNLLRPYKHEKKY